MSEHGALDPTESTHRVVTRQPAGANDWDETGRITVENRVVEALVPYGTAVHLCVDSGVAPLGDLTERLARVGEGGRVLSGARPEYRARLPEDADVLLSALAVEPGDTDAWVARLDALHEFAVVTPESWLYRSVPHHAHIRELNATARDGALAAVADELAPVAGSAVVPVDGLASWRSGDFRYELAWDALRRRKTGDSQWTAFDLSGLRRVEPRPERAELVARWRPVDSWPRRLVARVVRPASVDPPTRIEFPDAAAMAEAVAGLRKLNDELGYGFAVAEP
ncbi:hypothetical protein [Halorussus halobius]|uniref:hypothetical protein n=1 Tax=Halorussus halobius TaxID=1710537 RepID=UPI0010931EA4|nr:hypothetical protein [Halorussus halobius]